MSFRFSYIHQRCHSLNEERGYKRGGARPNLPPRKRKDLKMDSFKNCMRELYSIATIENTSEALSGP